MVSRELVGLQNRSGTQRAAGQRQHPAQHVVAIEEVMLERGRDVNERDRRERLRHGFVHIVQPLVRGRFGSMKSGSVNRPK